MSFFRVRGERTECICIILYHIEVRYISAKAFRLKIFQRNVIEKVTLKRRTRLRSRKEAVLRRFLHAFFPAWLKKVVTPDKCHFSRCAVLCSFFQGKYKYGAPPELSVGQDRFFGFTLPKSVPLRHNKSNNRNIRLSAEGVHQWWNGILLKENGNFQVRHGCPYRIAVL